MPIEQVKAGDYRPLPGVPDELVDRTGRVRPHWRRFIEQLSAISAEDMARRLARGDQYLLDSGVFYRQYGGGQSIERPWPLSHIPVLIDEADWSAMTTALIQRAHVLEALMADLYGENRLVAQGQLPAELVAENPEWLRPMVGVPPRSGHFLHFIAFEVGRGPDGKWWVLADRTQAPSGAGFALENRVATSRAFSDIYADANVHRLAGFFRDFRSALSSHRGEDEARVAILTPGPLNETYYEQAYIARYLGVTLAQGEDLVVDQGQLKLRTVSGLWPVDVLWRRLDASYADPLELDQASRLGTPGLVSALRGGQVTVVNALGSGILETRALMAFLPKLAPILTGAPLAMPNIATWWCGDRAARAQVLAARDRMVLSPSMSTGLPFEAEGGGIPAADQPACQLARHLVRHGPRLVAQEAVTLSTTPSLIDGVLQPRPMSLRVFLARTATGWQVMPGGFARIGKSADPKAIAMKDGGRAADVWITSASEVPSVSMVAEPSGPYRRAAPGALPSRAADNLYWLGRYVERSEGIVRLLRARNVRLAESGAAALPIVATLDPLFRGLGVDPREGIPTGLIDTLSYAITSAGQVRDRLSPDAWSALIDLNKTTRRMAKTVTPGDDAARALSALLRKLTGFSGLVHENMYRFFGWRFLSIGRHVERAQATAGLLAILAAGDAPPAALDLAVEVGDSVLSHRRRFSVATSRMTVVDLLALDEMNPRSVRYQLDGLLVQTRALPDAATAQRTALLYRELLRCHTALAAATPEKTDAAALRQLQGDIATVSDLLTEAYLH